MGLRAVLVEDDTLMRRMLANALRSRGISVVAEYATATDAVTMDSAIQPNVAILDLHLGKGPTGLDVAQSLRRRNPNIGIVFLTSFDDPRLLNPNLPSLPGNSQYLTKSKLEDIDSLIQAMTDAAVGRPSSAAPTMDQNPLEDFTDVQLETLRLVAQGFSNAEIAKRRFVTERSVEISISRIARVLGLSADATRNQRVHMARVYFRALGRSPIDEE